MKYTIALLSCETLNEKLAFIATNYKNVFMCERCHLWILDAMNVYFFYKKKFKFFKGNPYNIERFK